MNCCNFSINYLFSRRTKYHVAGYSGAGATSGYPNLAGSLQQLLVNGEDLLQLAGTRALDTRLQTTATITADTAHNQAWMMDIQNTGGFFKTFSHPAYLHCG